LTAKHWAGGGLLDMIRVEGQVEHSKEAFPECGIRIALGVGFDPLQSIARFHKMPGLRNSLVFFA